MTDAVLAALSHEARRDMVLLLSVRGPVPTSVLTDRSDMTRQSATRHLEVLESAGLVTSRRSGRQIVRELDLTPLLEMRTWMDTLAARWDERLARLAATYADPADEKA
ncbi:MAG: helix-turn-helix transcriptional regulator [Armatimonadetes bacterium]|nr:helix-turn-helix transcriptional regulator [Armatimonadota bacterium]